jgi:YidC/Oxa1 family membrane protein insertase
MDPINAVVESAYSLLVGLAGLLSSVAPAWGAVLAIVLTTLAVRTVLIPVGVAHMRAQLARARIAPALAAVQQRYAKSPERLQRETLALYKREGVSPLAGVLPALAQVPLVALVYAVFTQPVIAGHANELLAEAMLGVGLGESWVGVLGSAAVWPYALVGGVVLLMLGVIAWLARRQVLRTSPVSVNERAATMTRVGASLSFTTVVIGAFVPLAAALYLAVSSAWTLTERAIVRRVLTAG